MKKRKPFVFKQFSVDDSRCAQKVGTDSILLGSWVKSDAPKTILDIGAGSGLLALMMAQKFPQAEISAIEIEPNAVHQCRDNIKNSGFSNNFQEIHEDFLTYSFANKFDLIVSNPPYFDEDIKSKNTLRNLARHNDALPWTKFIRKLKTCLKPKGKACLIIPVKSLEKINKEFALNNVFPAQICWVSSFKNQAPTRCLLAISMKEVALQSETLTIYKEKNKYTEQFKEITREFYL